METETTLQDKIQACPPALQEIIAEFREVAPRERLEYLVDYALDLPPLPDWLQGKREQMEQVHECQAEVFLHTELEDGRVHFYVAVPMESPTVRGYAAILAEGLNGAEPQAVLQTPDDVYLLVGLHEAISPQRLNGLTALMRYMKRQVTRLSA